MITFDERRSLMTKPNLLAKEITRVGAIVSKIPDSLNGNQKKTFNNFYKKVTPQVKKLINSSAYK